MGEQGPQVYAVHRRSGDLVVPLEVRRDEEGEYECGQTHLHEGSARVIATGPGENEPVHREEDKEHPEDDRRQEQERTGEFAAFHLHEGPLRRPDRHRYPCDGEKHPGQQTQRAHQR